MVIIIDAERVNYTAENFNAYNRMIKNKIVNGQLDIVNTVFDITLPEFELKRKEIFEILLKYTVYDLALLIWEMIGAHSFFKQLCYQNTCREINQINHTHVGKWINSQYENQFYYTLKNVHNFYINKVCEWELRITNNPRHRNRNVSKTFMNPDIFEKFCELKRNSKFKHAFIIIWNYRNIKKTNLKKIIFSKHI